MLIPFNNTPTLDKTWNENDDIDDRTYWPNWTDFKKVSYFNLEKTTVLYCRINVSLGVIRDVLVCSQHYETSVMAPGNVFCYHVKPMGNGIYVTVNDMLKTIQQNFWRFRYSYWTILAKEGLHWCNLTEQT